MHLFRNKARFQDEVLFAPRPNPNLEYHYIYYIILYYIILYYIILYYIILYYIILYYIILYYIILYYIICLATRFDQFYDLC